MQKAKKKILSFVIALIIIAILVFMVLFVFYGIPDLGRAERNVRMWIKTNAETEIPQNSQMVYKYSAERGLSPGRALEYFVFVFDSAPDDWLEDSGFSNEADEEIEGKISKLNLIEDNSIPSEYAPDFNKSYYWLQAPNLVYFVYQPDNRMLMVILYPR